MSDRIGHTLRDIIHATAHWVRCRDTYRPVAFASAPTPEANAGAPRPTEVDHLFSAVFKYGERVFAFNTEQDRDKFVANAVGAKPCEDPVP